MDNRVNALLQIFKEREKFILIGLTGRTGSGCSTAAELLSSSLNDLDLPKPAMGGFKSNDERKEKIIYDYTQEHWHKFKVISIRDVITSFVLENEYDKFESYVTELIKNKKEKKRIKSKLKGSIKKQYDELHKERKKIRSLKEKTKNQVKIKAKLSYEFHFKTIPDFSKELKTSLEHIELVDSEDTFTSVFQKLGNNVRASGNALRESYVKEKVYTLAKRLNRLIKAIGLVNKRSFIVIDAIRNPFEAQFLRERYSAFYLVSINTPNCDRIERLINLGHYTQKKIEALDKNEYPKKLKGIDKFIRQDMQKCTELSDIHINNPHDKGHDLNRLKRQLAWYIALIKHPALVTPTPLERSMQIAYQIKLNSGCISRQVGAAITDEYYSIKAVGWNSPAEGQTPCLLRSATDLLGNNDKRAFSDYENTDEEFRELVKINYKKVPEKINNYQKHSSGRTPCYCFKDLQNRIDGDKNQVHTRSLHGEENAFLQISKYGGQGIKGGILFSTASPCELCAKKAYQLGIEKIFYIDPYPGISLDHIFGSGTKRPTVELFSGALGRAHHQLYTPIFPYKDEQELLMCSELIGTVDILTDEIDKAKKIVKSKKAELSKAKKI